MIGALRSIAQMHSIAWQKSIWSLKVQARANGPLIYVQAFASGTEHFQVDLYHTFGGPSSHTMCLWQQRRQHVLLFQSLSIWR